MWWIVTVLALAGLGLIFLEFFIPGIVFAVMGALFLCASLVCFSLLDVGIGWAVGYFFLLVILVVAVCKLAIYAIKKSGKKQSFYLERDQEGFTSPSVDSFLVGKEGVALSELRPSGHILVEGRKEHALAERGYISRGCRVFVIEKRSSYLVVKEVKEM